VVALDGHGIRLADQVFPASLIGYQQLLNWLRSVGSTGKVFGVPTGSGPRGQYPPCPHASQERQG
jgi:hypothetical protein